MQWRGLVQQTSHDRLAPLMNEEKLTLYSGFDPTAPSLHVGNLMPILGLRRAQMLGHHPVALVGGATSMIGDPSGKSSERNLMGAETIDANTQGLKEQLGRFIDFSSGTLVNNLDWMGPMSFLDVLRDVGKHFSVNAMIAKESVRARLNEREQGISYTEFSYMIIQAYDFLVLFDKHQCKLQIGGSEQWGNITAGIDLVRRERSAEAYGLTLPLLLDASGKKFGKTESGAVWLDAERTSPYDFYQYFVRTDDRDINKTLRFLTLLDQKTVLELEDLHARAPETREVAKVLARTMTEMVHGKDEAMRAEQATAALFGKPEAGALPAGTPTYDFDEGKLASAWPLVEALVDSGMLPSRGGARREIQGGGIYVNDQRIGDVGHSLGPADLQDGMIRLRRGKKKHMVLKPTK